MGVFAYLTLKPISYRINWVFLPLGQKEAALLLCLQYETGGQKWQPHSSELGDKGITENIQCNIHG